MKKLLTLTVCALLTINCAARKKYPIGSMDTTMNYYVETQAQLDQGNQRIDAYKEELLRQGFRLVSVSSFNSRKEFILEGQHGRLKQLRVRLVTNTSLEKEAPELAGGVYATISDELAMQEYEEFSKRVNAIVTGYP